MHTHLHALRVLCPPLAGLRPCDSSWSLKYSVSLRTNLLTSWSGLMFFNSFVRVQVALENGREWPGRGCVKRCHLQPDGSAFPWHSSDVGLSRGLRGRQLGRGLVRTQGGTGDPSPPRSPSSDPGSSLFLDLFSFPPPPHSFPGFLIPSRGSSDVGLACRSILETSASTIVQILSVSLQETKTSQLKA